MPNPPSLPCEGPERGSWEPPPGWRRGPDSHGNDDLASGVSVHEISERLRDLAEGVVPVDHRSYLSCFKELLEHPEVRGAHRRDEELRPGADEARPQHGLEHPGKDAAHRAGPATDDEEKSAGKEDLPVGGQ